jgi:hypothetical protein
MGSVAADAIADDLARLFRVSRQAASIRLGTLQLVRPVNDDQRRLLEAVYDHFRQCDAWPTFGQIDRPLRRVGPDPAHAAGHVARRRRR